MCVCEKERDCAKCCVSVTPECETTSGRTSDKEAEKAISIS